MKDVTGEEAEAVIEEIAEEVEEKVEEPAAEAVEALTEAAEEVVEESVKAEEIPENTLKLGESLVKIDAIKELVEKVFGTFTKAE